MNNSLVFARISYPTSCGTVATQVLPVPLFDIKKISQISWYGLPCACCYNHSHWSPVGDYHSDESGNRVVHFCQCCDAIICRSCAYYITQNRDGPKLGCAWCGSDVDPDSVTRTLTNEEQSSPWFQCYSIADRNIRDLLCQRWGNSMRITYPGHDVSKLYWADVVSSMGWRFFVGLEDLLMGQHRSQSRLLMALMDINRIFPVHHPQNHRQLAVRDYSNFHQLPDEMQFVYHRSRRHVIVTRLSLWMISRLLRGFPLAFFYLRRYVLSKSSQELMASLGICELCDPLDFSDDTMQSDC
jgi:hypothetical protein